MCVRVGSWAINWERLGTRQWMTVMVGGEELWAVQGVAQHRTNRPSTVWKCKYVLQSRKTVAERIWNEELLSSRWRLRSVRWGGASSSHVFGEKCFLMSHHRNWLGNEVRWEARLRVSDDVLRDTSLSSPSPVKHHLHYVSTNFYCFRMLINTHVVFV